MSDPPTHRGDLIAWSDDAVLGSADDWRAVTERVIRDPTSRRPFQEGETVRRRDGSGGAMLVKVILDGGTRCLCGWYDDLNGELVEAFHASQLMHYSDPDLS